MSTYPSPPNSKPPNILFILSDNHPADLLGCYGNPEIHTPHLDRLAAQGMQFNNAFCVNAMCSPSRASILTGLMPSQHGIHTWLDDRLMDRWPSDWNAIGEFTSLPQLLKSIGYQTALIGKYHLGVPFKPQNGFDHWVTYPLGHTISFWGNEVIENGHRSMYPGHIVDYFTDQAVSYIQKQQPGQAQPFFLYLPYNAPYGHWPAIQGPARNRFAALYQDTPMRSVPREGLSQELIDRFLQRHQASGQGLDYSAHLRLPNDLVSLRNYFSQMSMVDDGVGRVLAALQQQGLAEETLVIYSCDHGFSLGHNGFWGHGQATWPANAHRPAYHIPLIIRHPRQIKPGATCDRLVSQIDLFATMLAAAGMDEDTTAPINTPSVNLLPLLKGDDAERDDAIFLEQEETRAIRTPEWLYARRFKGSPAHPLGDALYHLRADPEERDNCIANPAHAPILRLLEDRLDAFFARYSLPHHDLWQGGSTKSNSDKPWLWQDAWGSKWRPLAIQDPLP